MKHNLLVILFLSAFFSSFSQPSVSKEKMDSVYEAVKTPFKYGMVIEPDDPSKKIDCPSVFRRGNKWYMTYIIFDGRGYETWLAESADLLDWETRGRLLSFSDSTEWDGHQKAGYIALQNTKWGGDYTLRKHAGKYWMGYFGGSETGYEAGQLAMGMAYTKKNPARPHEWKRLPEPILTANDPDTRWWENRKLFKNSVIHDPQQQTGYPFVMYYNANGDTSGNIKTRWYERIGMAVSNDMIHWKRYGKEPVMQHSQGITGDALLQKMDDLWVMFYFGAFWEGRTDAFNRFACSYDLVNWTDWTGPDLINSSTSYDAKFAHKSFVLKHKGIVYHYYCAVDDKDNRGIAVATSIDLKQPQE